MTVNNILINNGKLGRQGKTTLAYTLYQQAQSPYQFITNDIENASIDLNRCINASDLRFFPPGTEIDVDPESNAIFDFGGEPDDRLLKVMQYVDVVIIPISFESVSELTITIRNINAVREVNENIIIIINKTDTSDVVVVETALKAVFSDLPTFVINKSRYITRLASNNQTVFDVADASKMDAGQLNRRVLPQFQAFMNHLRQHHGYK